MKTNDWSPMGRRKRGRPRKLCRNYVDEAVEMKNLIKGDWKNKKDYWKWLRDRRPRRPI